MLKNVRVTRSDLSRVSAGVHRIDQECLQECVGLVKNVCRSNGFGETFCRSWWDWLRVSVGAEGINQEYLQWWEGLVKGVCGSGRNYSRVSAGVG